MVLAQTSARQFNHNYIGTEHLLHSMLMEGEGIAAQALGKFDLSVDGVSDQIITIIGKGQQATTGHIPFTPRAKKVMELSLREALQLGHNYIGTEHILLGMIREGEGVGAQIISSSPGMAREVRVRGDKQWNDLLRDQVMMLIGLLPKAVENAEPDYRHEVSGETGPPAAVQMDEELRLLNAMEDFTKRLREQVENRGEILKTAELSWLTEMSALGRHEAKEHETTQRLIDLHARAVKLAATAGALLAEVSDLRQELSNMIPAPPSQVRDIEEEEDEDGDN